MIELSTCFRFNLSSEVYRILIQDQKLFGLKSLNELMNFVVAKYLPYYIKSSFNYEVLTDIIREQIPYASDSQATAIIKNMYKKFTFNISKEEKKSISFIVTKVSKEIINDLSQKRIIVDDYPLSILVRNLITDYAHMSLNEREKIFFQERITDIQNSIRAGYHLSVKYNNDTIIIQPYDIFPWIDEYGLFLGGYHDHSNMIKLILIRKITTLAIIKTKFERVDSINKKIRAMKMNTKPIFDEKQMNVIRNLLDPHFIDLLSNFSFLTKKNHNTDIPDSVINDLFRLKFNPQIDVSLSIDKD